MMKIKLWVNRKKRYSKFIKLDVNGICVALICCHQSPGESWIEVDDYCLSWLGKNPPATVYIIVNNA